MKAAGMKRQKVTRIWREGAELQQKRLQGVSEETESYGVDGSHW